jgi:hypothetical protein
LITESGGSPAAEERPYRRGDRSRVDRVARYVDRLPHRVRQHRCHRVRCGREEPDRERAHVRVGGGPREHQRLLTDAGEAARGRPALAEDRRVVGEGRRQREQPVPERRSPRTCELVVARAAQPHERGERLVGPSPGQRLVELGAVRPPPSDRVPGDAVRHVVHHEAGDRQTGRGGLQRERTTAGRAEDVRLAPGRVEHRRQVLDLTLHRVRRRVPAAATAPARVVVHGELVGQRRHEHRVLRTVVEPAADQHHRRAATLAPVGDLRPIRGRHRPRATPHAR